MIKRYNQFLSRISLLLFYVFLLSGCATSLQVFTDYDSQQSFGNYNKFSWLTEEPAIVTGDFPISETIKTRFTNAIQSNLEAKGFVLTDNADEAQFLVSYTLGARSNVSIFQLHSEVYDNSENWLWGKEYHSHIFTRLDAGKPSTYTKGVLGIDIYDVSKMAPVWHARAAKQLNQSDLESDGGNAEFTVSSLLENFPPR